MNLKTVIFSSQRLDGLVEMSIPFEENVLADWEQFGTLKNFPVTVWTCWTVRTVWTWWTVWTTLTGTAEGPSI